MPDERVVSAAERHSTLVRAVAAKHAWWVGFADPFPARACERDLRVLERHQPLPPTDDDDDEPLRCSAWPCWRWPCVEVQDLATVYGVEGGAL